MTDSGYSGTPLIEKLGIKPGDRAIILNAPTGYGPLLGELPEGAELVHDEVGDFDFIQHFFTEKAALEETFPRLKKHLKTSGTLWISWPKLTSDTPSDLNENIVREVGLASGLVDVKVATIDSTWSGLKFVYRLKDRK